MQNKISVQNRIFNPRLSEIIYRNFLKRSDNFFAYQYNSPNRIKLLSKFTFAL